MQFQISAVVAGILIMTSAKSWGQCTSDLQCEKKKPGTVCNKLIPDREPFCDVEENVLAIQRKQYLAKLKSSCGNPMSEQSMALKRFDSSVQRAPLLNTSFRILDETKSCSEGGDELNKFSSTRAKMAFLRKLTLPYSFGEKCETAKMCVAEFDERILKLHQLQCGRANNPERFKNGWGEFKFSFRSNGQFNIRDVEFVPSKNYKVDQARRLYVDAKLGNEPRPFLGYDDSEDFERSVDEFNLLNSGPEFLSAKDGEKSLKSIRVSVDSTGKPYTIKFLSQGAPERSYPFKDRRTLGDLFFDPGSSTPGDYHLAVNCCLDSNCRKKFEEPSVSPKGNSKAISR